MALKWNPPDPDELVRLYLAGESQEALATRYGVTRIPIRRALVEAGVDVRGRADVNRANAAKRTPEENRALAAHAHRGARGRKHTLEERCKMALSRERNQSGVTRTERYLAELLDERVGPITLQKAVGPYNVDVCTAVGPVAVEVFGGNWHGSGRHLARAPKRFRYLLDEGWSFIIVWTDSRHAPLLPAAADYIATFAEFTGCDPTARREYRVIWGTGEEATPTEPKLDKIAHVPSLAGRNR